MAASTPQPWWTIVDHMRYHKRIMDNAIKRKQELEMRSTLTEQMALVFDKEIDKASERYAEFRKQCIEKGFIKES